MSDPVRADGEALLCHAVAGLQSTMAEAMAVVTHGWGCDRRVAMVPPFDWRIWQMLMA